MDYFVLDLTKSTQMKIFQTEEDYNSLEKIMFLEGVFLKTKSKEIAGDLINEFRKYKRTLPRTYSYFTKKHARKAIKRLRQYKRDKISYDEVI
jgi:hypothetical protein